MVDECVVVDVVGGGVEEVDDDGGDDEVAPQTITGETVIKEFARVSTARMYVARR